MENIINKIIKLFEPESEGTVPFDSSKINRNNLNFNKNKICEISLKTNNIYCCLTCGIFLNGRSEDTEVYKHCINSLHYYIINLDNYYIFDIFNNKKISNTELIDIIYNFNIKYDKELLDLIISNNKTYNKINSKLCDIGCISLKSQYKFNNLKFVVYLFGNIEELVRYYLLTDINNSDSFNYSLQKIYKKIYNPISLYTNISLFELELYFEKYITIIDKSYDIIFYIKYFLNKFPINLKKLFKGNISYINKCKETKEISIKDTPFQLLTLELPEITLFKHISKNINKSVSLNTLISKYNNNTFTLINNEIYSKIIITNFPKYLILIYNKIKPKRYNFEINKTIIEDNNNILTIKYLKNDKNISYELISSISITQNQIDNDITNKNNNISHNNYLKSFITGNYYNIDSNSKQHNILEDDMVQNNPYIQIYKIIN